MEDNDWKDELTDDYIHEIEADFEALKQRHKKLVDACNVWKNSKRQEVQSEESPEEAQNKSIFDLLDEEPIND